MDDLPALLDSAAADFAPTPPTIAELVARRRDQVRTRAAAVITAVCVALAASGVAIALRPDHDVRRRPPTAPTAFGNYAWRSLPPAPIVPRTDPATVWTGTEMFVWGGTTGRRNFADGALYDPAKRSWTKLPSAPLSARSEPVAVLLGRAVLVWGGSGKTDGARYDLDARRWSILPAVPNPGPGSIPGAFVAAGDRAVLLTLPPGRNARTIEVAAYDQATNRWSSRPSLVEDVDHDVVQVPALGVGSTVYAWPSWSHVTRLSADRFGSSYGTDAFRLDAGASRWVRTPVAPVRGNTGFGAQRAGAQILFPQSQDFCGGCFGPPAERIESALVSLTGAARTIPNGPLGPGGNNLFWVGGGLLSYNSYAQITGPRARTNPGDLAWWDEATNRWARLPSAAVPVHAEQGVVIWTGHQLIVWGLSTGRSAVVGTGGVEFAPR